MKKISISAELFGRILSKLPAEQAKEFKSLTEGEADSELTEEQYNKIFSGLLSIAAASEHPEVIGKIKNSELGKIDAQLIEVLKGRGLKEDEITALFNGKVTADRIKLTSEKIQELAKKESGKTDTQREQEWQQTKSKLEADLAAANTALTNEQQGREADRTTTAINTFLGNPKNVSLLANVPLETQLDLLGPRILSRLDKLGAKIAVENGAIKLVDKNDPSKAYHQPGSAEPLAFKDFSEGIAKEAGLWNSQPGKVENVPIPGAANPAAAANAQANSAIAFNHRTLSQIGQNNQAAEVAADAQ